MQLLKTSDYSIFKKMHQNRDLNSINLRQIVASIEANNMLEFRPILVNKNMEVIDGQHRLEAAKFLGVPIYYQVNQESSGVDIVLLNANQKKWDLEDYLNFYCYEGKVEYQKIADFIKEKKIGVGFFLKTFAKGNARLTYNTFREGTFIFPQPHEIVEVERILAHAQEIVGVLKRFLGHKINLQHVSTMTRAISQLQEHPDYDPSIMISKLTMRLDKFRKCSDVPGYVSMFKDLYNWKNQNPLD